MSCSYTSGSQGVVPGSALVRNAGSLAPQLVWRWPEETETWGRGIVIVLSQALQEVPMQASIWESLVWVIFRAAQSPL